MNTIQRRVLVDVYAWVAATATHRSVPMEGVFRHAEYLCRNFDFVPALFLGPDEKLQGEAMHRLEEYLGKMIQIYYNDLAALATECSAWISLAVDFPAPFLDERPLPFKKVAVLHDVLSHDWHFGEEKKQQFIRGMRANDVFLNVSDVSKGQFIAVRAAYCGLNLSLPLYVSMPNAHRFNTWEPPPEEIPPDRKFLTLLHSVYPRKNLTAGAHLLRRVSPQRQIVHIGKVFDTSNDDMSLLKNGTHVKFLGAVSDREAQYVLLNTYAFACMSATEGFSVPPMEAILCGVPYVYLSDIDAHREIYGDMNVNFVSLHEPHPEIGTKKMRPEDAEKLFHRYHKHSVYSEAVTYLNSLQ